jgi:hypothetical protein
MIRSLLLIILSFGVLNFADAQTMQASIGIGSTPRRVKLYMKPVSGTVTGQLATLNFNIAIPSSTPGPIPTLTITNNPFPAATFQINVPYDESGYIHYNIANLNAFTVTALSSETEVLELEFDGNPNTAPVSLVTLPDQGLTGFALFFCSGAASSDGSNLYYTRAGTTVTNTFSYTFPNFIPPGTSTSTAVLGTGILLPLNWLSFNVVKQGNDGLLNWSVANDDDNHHYELQRSVNGTSDFKTIATVNKSASTDYKYTDAAINNLGTSILYYRIKQVDINGRTSYSDTRLLRLDVKGNQISVFPNPVKKGFYVNIPFNNSERGNVKLNLVGINGQLIRSRQITTAQASNYYFDIADMALAAGSYNLQIVFDEKIMETKKLNIIR